MPSDLSPVDRDLMIRTIIGEAGDQGPQGQAAVAHVIMNRVAAGKYGQTPSDVVLAPHQFEPWSTRSGELRAINPNSAAYQNVGDIVDMSASGDVPDPTGGATHFFAPKAQAALGRNVPAWATPQSQTAVIGGHTFFAPNGRVGAPTSAIDPLDAINRAIATPDDGK
jgi:spore germination cell wall hydrolase CwlJ-like protein